MKALILLVAIAILGEAHADTTCSHAWNGTPICVAGIRSESLEGQEAYSHQEREFWCWAASISMIFKYFGYTVRQEDIVKQTFGAVANKPAWGFHITEQLNRRYRASDGRTFDVTARVYDLMAGKRQINNYDLIRSLNENRPLLIGTGSHAMVLTAVQYVPLPNGEPGPIVGAVVRDPWPGRGRRELSIQELYPHYVADIQISGGDARKNEGAEDAYQQPSQGSSNPQTSGSESSEQKQARSNGAGISPSKDIDELVTYLSTYIREKERYSEPKVKVVDCMLSVTAYWHLKRSTTTKTDRLPLHRVTEAYLQDILGPTLSLHTKGYGVESLRSSSRGDSESDRSEVLLIPVRHDFNLTHFRTLLTNAKATCAR